MTLTRTEVRDLLDRYQITPKRSLGQNFVVEPNTVRRIAELAEIKPRDQVLEIGPGIGSLTLALLDQSAELTAIEIDQKLVEVIREVTAGKKIKSSNLPWGKLGLSICYDLRFPNMFRKLSKVGCDYISIPSAFTETTGKRHWHSLLKARAIENFCYIFAPAQGGTHYNGKKTFGHSMVVSPDGKILKELKKSQGVITVSIDPSLPKKLRSIIPSLKSD